MTSPIPVALLEPITHAESADKIASDAWVGQEKYDGDRLLLELSDDRVTAQARSGRITNGWTPLFGAGIRELGMRDLVLDGEWITDVGPERYVAFDVLRLNGDDIRGEPYRARLAYLEKMFRGRGAVGEGTLRLAPTAYTSAEKAALAKRLRESDAEGMVFKKLDARYHGYRSFDQVKWKFWEEAIALVIAQNDTGRILEGNAPVPVQKPSGKRSFQAAMVDPEKEALVFVGDITVPINRPVPEPGTLADIEYLNAGDRDRPRLYQAKYRGTRSDVTLAAAMTTTLKYRRTGTRPGHHPDR